MARARNSASPLLTLAALVVAIAALHLAKEILLPLALAILISFLLTPLANRLERLGLGRVFSVISVVSVAFLVLGVLGYIVTLQLVNLGEQLPGYQKELAQKVKQLRPESKMLKDISQTIEEVEKELTEDSSEDDATGKSTGDKSSPQKATKEEGPEEAALPSSEEKASPDEASPLQGNSLPAPGEYAGQTSDWWGELVASVRRQRADSAQEPIEKVSPTRRRQFLSKSSGRRHRRSTRSSTGSARWSLRWARRPSRSCSSSSSCSSEKTSAIACCNCLARLIYMPRPRR
jgi:hypothetical protein